MPDRPAHTIRIGSLDASIWENKTKSTSFYNVKIQRSYKSDDAWVTTEYMRLEDLPVVEKLAHMCTVWVLNHANNK